ncbi:hypothetical protein SUGI_0852460 [Cryptomeria japonica]|nr:hypothetical protein SUGI_0852460 [Cryptomeria japonica]
MQGICVEMSMPAPMNVRCPEYVKSSLSLSKKLGFFRARGDRLTPNRSLRLARYSAWQYEKWVKTYRFGYLPGSGRCSDNLYDGSRHETMKYGPDVDVPKDEMTHGTYWQYVKFVDPYTEEEREEFDRCNHYCKSEGHETKSGTFDRSYCTKNLWNPPIKSTGQNLSSRGYLTDDGHHYRYDHSMNVPHHVIFIIDRSSSMGDRDISPTMAMFNNHSCRLGCVYEVFLRFIQVHLKTISDDSVSVVLFDASAKVVVEMEDMQEGVVNRLLQYFPGRGTNYSSTLDAAEKLLVKGT